ncbi:MAG: porin [Nitrospirota bacterium]
MKRFRLKVLKMMVLAGMLALPMSAMAGSADGLTDLLIQKGVITSDELKAQKKKWLKMEGRIQTRYTLQETDDPKDKASEFSLPRVRFGAAGSPFENVEFKLEVDFIPDSKQTDTLTADTITGAVSSSKGNIESATKVSIKDVKLVFTQFDYANVTVGHFKVPFARQEITSSGNQQFVERSEVVRKEAQSRDVGLMIGEYNGKKLFEYAVGAFNGTKTANKNDNAGFLLAGRVAVNPFGEMKYSESNLEGESLRLSVGANYQTNELTTSGANKKLDYSSSSDDLDTDTTKYGVDLAAKFLDNASLFGEYIQAKSEPKGGTEVKAKGYYVQGGYFVLPPKFEVTARFEGYDPDDSVDNTSDIQWTTIGLNYFFKKHDWKVQANYIMKDEEEDSTTGEDKDDDTVMVQLQVKF